MSLSAPRWPISRRGLLVMAAVGLIAVAVGGWAVVRARTPVAKPVPQPVQGHWAAVTKGREYLRRGRPDLALKVVSDIRDEAPGAGEAMAVAGMSLVAFNQLKGARLAFERGLKLQPNQPLAAKTLAAICLSTGDADRALIWLQAAAKLEPRDFRPWFAMGKVYHDLGQPAQAADAYAQALRRFPSHMESQIGQIAELLEANRQSEAGPLLAKLLPREPKNAQVLGLAARHARDSGESAEASKLADRALAIDPNNLDALLARAKIRLLASDAAGALPDAERAVVVNANHLGALQLLAQVLGRLGQTERAAATMDRHRRALDRTARLDQLTKEIARRPDDPEPRWQMGQVAVEGGLTVLARQCFQAALDLDPTFTKARESLDQLTESTPEPSPRARPDM